MSDFLTQWFRGFEEGIDCLDLEAKEKFFCNCGRNCANTGIIKVYEELYNNSGKDLDMFFTRLNEMDGVGGDIVDSGKLYELSFPRCLCDLHTKGYIHSDSICECSRQSIIYVMMTLEPGLEFRVEKISTVLGGGKECRFRISLVNNLNLL